MADTKKITNPVDFNVFVNQIGDMKENQLLSDKLNLVKKDGKVIRVLKKIVMGLFKDPYAHLKADRVAQSLLGILQESGDLIYDKDLRKFKASVEKLDKKTQGKMQPVLNKIDDMLAIRELHKSNQNLEAKAQNAASELQNALHEKGSFEEMLQKALEKTRQFEAEIARLQAGQGSQAQDSVATPPPPPPLKASAPPPPPPKGGPKPPPKSSPVVRKAGQARRQVGGQSPSPQDLLAQALKAKFAKVNGKEADRSGESQEVDSEWL